MDRRTDGRTDGRTEGWTDGRTDGRTNGRTRRVDFYRQLQGRRPYCARSSCRDRSCLSSPPARSPRPPAHSPAHPSRAPRAVSPRFATPSAYPPRRHTARPGAPVRPTVAGPALRRGPSFVIASIPVSCLLISLAVASAPGRCIDPAQGDRAAGPARQGHPGRPAGPAGRTAGPLMDISLINNIDALTLSPPAAYTELASGISVQHSASGRTLSRLQSYNISPGPFLVIVSKNETRVFLLNRKTDIEVFCGFGISVISNTFNKLD